MIYIVSGLPRSGTSLMMQMLQAGGIDVLTDEERKADTDNPGGYLELESVKRLYEDTSWLSNAQGNAVKIISYLLKYLPADYEYKIVFMLRNVEEILKSQDQMLMNRGEQKETEGSLRYEFNRHLIKIRLWMGRQSNMKVYYCDYNQLIQKPGPQVKALARFLDIGADITTMRSCVKPELYRQRNEKK